jgi:diguanylate cyclase (GGDEF)-like protein
VTISIGVTSVAQDQSSPTDFIKAADERLYQAKQEGRNKVVGG